MFCSKQNLFLETIMTPDEDAGRAAAGPPERPEKLPRWWEDDQRRQASQRARDGVDPLAGADRLKALLAEAAGYPQLDEEEEEEDPTG